MTNYIALRESPDWLTFDLEQSRAFLRGIGFQEDLVVRYAQEWRRVFGCDFRQFRHDVKLITLESIQACRNSTLISINSVANLVKDEDLVLFVDDDDWVSPHLFETVQSQPTNHLDGFIWGSIFVGKFLSDLPDVPMGSPIIVKRRLDDTVYTNNYIVSGSLLISAGLRQVQEHFDAQTALCLGRFKPNRMASYLSCTNKHPGCTVFIKRNSSAIYAEDRLFDAMREYEEALNIAELDQETGWIGPYVQRLRDVVRTLRRQN